MSYPYFVMLAGNDGSPLPLMADDEAMAVFPSEEQATAAALRNPLGEAYGFEVYQWPAVPDSTEGESE